MVVEQLQFPDLSVLAGAEFPPALVASGPGLCSTDKRKVLFKTMIYRLLNFLNEQGAIMADIDCTHVWPVSPAVHIHSVDNSRFKETLQWEFIPTSFH